MISFGIALSAVVIAIYQLPAEPWVQALFALGTLYLVTSAFTLAKVIRDRQDEEGVVKRVDQARVDKLLAEHDPFNAPAWPWPGAQLHTSELPFAEVGEMGAPTSQCSTILPFSSRRKMSTSLVPSSV